MLECILCATVIEVLPAGTCPACGQPRYAEWAILTSGGVEVRRTMTRRWCPSHCTHDMIVAAERQMAAEREIGQEAS